MDHQRRSNLLSTENLTQMAEMAKKNNKKKINNKINGGYCMTGKYCVVGEGKAELRKVLFGAPPSWGPKLLFLETLDFWLRGSDSARCPS